MKKRIYCTIAAICMVLLCSLNSNVLLAHAEIQDNENVAITVFEKNDTRMNYLTLDGDIHYLGRTRGNSAPIDFHSLKTRNYTYIISGMRNYVYTDVYFDTDSNGCISISTNGINAGGNAIKISLYKYGLLFDTLATSWTGDPQSIQGLGFSNLNSTSYYYFKFETTTDNTTVSGTGIIHHP